MRITWIGQAGFLLKTDDLTILIDPYLSNSCEKINSRLKRNMPINKEFINIKPDILILTHDHMDHTDYETLPFYINENSNVRVVLSRNAHDKVKKLGGNTNDYVIFEPGVKWSEKSVNFTAVKAVHSEESAFGFIAEYKNKKYYFSGDTLYSNKIIESLPNDIYAAFIPINGWGNNMNIIDAHDFAQNIDVKHIVPVHWGMFDNINPLDLNVSNMVIPKVYKEICFD